MNATDLIPEVRRLMSEGKADRAIAYAINHEAGTQVVTRDRVRNLIGQIKVQDAAAKAAGGPVEVPFNEVLRHDPEAWAIRISARWRMGVEAIISTGKLLLEAKDALPHGAFGAMLEEGLPFKARQAQMLMAIASDGRLSNPQYVALLPPSWGTIYDVTRLSDDEFTRAVETGVIRPDMERKDIEQIRPRPARHMRDAYTPESSDGPGSPSADDMDPAALSLQQGLATTTTDGTAARWPQGELRDGGDVVKPEGQPEVPDVSPVPLGPSETIMPGGGLAIAHRRIEPEDSLDFFPTPPWATRALLERVLQDDPRSPATACWSVWEPACGEGHMAEVLREYCDEVLATDVHDYGYGDRTLDYLSEEASLACPDWIITNPPFGGKSEAFVLRALEQSTAGVAMFVRLQWLEGTGRYERIFKDNPPTIVAIFSERVPLHKERWEPDGGTMTAYIWLIWIKGEEPRAPFWIPPGCREALTRPDDAERFTQSPVARLGNEAAEAAE